MSSLEAATWVAKQLRAAGHEAYFAGGCVRDRILGREPGDYDVATSAVPDEVQKLFKRTVPVGKQFGVILVLAQGREVEVATFRSDFSYTDGRHPDKVTFSDMKSDVVRRDFTINGMMQDPETGEIVDLVGGRKDLEAKLIRAIGDPDRRFDEDRLRMLRAVRFAAQLGFEIEPATLAAISKRSAELSSVSRERVREELEKVLACAGVPRGLSLLGETGLLKCVVPRFANLPEDRWKEIIAIVEGLRRRTFALSMAAMLRSEPSILADADARDLRLSNDERERVVWLVAHMPHLARAEAMKPSEWKPLLAHPAAEDLLELFRATRLALGRDLAGHDLLIRRRTEGNLDPPRLLTGEEVIALGVPRGPMVGQALAAVRVAQLDGEVTTAEEAKSLVRKIAGGPAGAI